MTRSHEPFCGFPNGIVNTGAFCKSPGKPR